MKANQELLERRVAEVIEKEHLAKTLDSGKKLKIKFGIDPTAPELHLGHTVPLLKLKEFQCGQVLLQDILFVIKNSIKMK